MLHTLALAAPADSFAYFVGNPHHERVSHAKRSVAVAHAGVGPTLRKHLDLVELVGHQPADAAGIPHDCVLHTGWHSKLGNGAMADAVIDRVIYSSYAIHIEGNESMRKKMSNLKQ